MPKSMGYITGFNLVSSYAAMLLKLSYIQVVILNLYLINWLAGKLEKYDEENQACQLYRFNVYYWAEYFNIHKIYFKRNLIALTKPITCLDGLQVQIMFKNKRHRVFYVGMELSVIHKLVDMKLFNAQCDFHGKPELKGVINSDEESIMSKFNRELLFEIEDKTDKPELYAETIIKKIIHMADENDAKIFRDGKYYNVFSHLKNGEFKNKRKGIDDTCRLINDIFSGRFFRDYKRYDLFGTINKEYLAFKNVEVAIDKLLFLIKHNNKSGIESFIFKCAKNYFDALKPGRETYRDIKSSFPVNIKSFFLHTNRDGTHVANFLMFYFSTLSEKDLQLNQAINRVKNIVPESVFDRLLDYETYVLENQIFSYWLNIKKLALKIKSIINDKKTSYSMSSCFDIVFDRVDKVSEYHNKVLPGYFDPYEGQTASDAINLLFDK